MNLYKVDKILSTRIRHIGRRKVQEFPIKWLGYDDAHNFEFEFITPGSQGRTSGGSAPQRRIMGGGAVGVAKAGASKGRGSSGQEQGQAAEAH